MNPYAKFIDGQEPQSVIAETAGRLHAIARTIGPAGWERRPEEGKWNAREIVAHLADTEIVFAMRLRQTLAEPHHVIQPFDQDAWAAHYDAYDMGTALEVFARIRDWNLQLLAAAPAESMSKPVTHPERGTMTFGTIVDKMAGHDLNHIAQLEALA
ncbi:MAG: DinB family protein [Acidobacteria bacterium]|nr:DinB family protein [Acidobacteriota bacterium]